MIEGGKNLPFGKAKAMLWASQSREGTKAQNVQQTDPDSSISPLCSQIPDNMSISIKQSIIDWNQAIHIHLKLHLEHLTASPHNDR